MGQLFAVIAQTVTADRFQRLGDAGVQQASSFMQETAVGHLMRQCMLEGIDTFRKQTRLIEEFRRLQMRQATGQHLFRQLSDGLK